MGCASRTANASITARRAIHAPCCRGRAHSIALAACLLAHASASASDADDQTWRAIKASLTDRVQRIHDVLITTDQRIEPLAGYRGPKLYTSLHDEWGWSDNKEFLREMYDEKLIVRRPLPGDLSDTDAEMGSGWAYNGQKTLLLTYDEDHRILCVQVQNGPPDLGRRLGCEPPRILGLRALWMDGDLATLAKHPQSRFRATIDAGGRSLPGFELTQPDSQGTPVTITAAFDPDRDWIPTFVKAVLSYKEDWRRATMPVTETMSISDGNGPETLIVPRVVTWLGTSEKAGDESRATTTIKDIQINSPLDPQLFDPVIPDGVPVDVPPSEPGGFPHTYISGNEVSQTQGLALQSAAIAMERQRLLKTHGRLDATPVPDSRLRRWLTAIGIGLLLSALVVVTRRRVIDR